MESQSVEDFFKKVLQNEEIAAKAVAISKDNCIIDMETLMELSTNDMEKMQFPIGIIKKVQPYLKHRCSLQEAIKIQEEVTITKKLIQKNSTFMLKKINLQQENVENLAQQLSKETEKLNDIQINYQKLQKLESELEVFEKLNSSQLISEYNKIKTDLEQIKNLFQKLNLKYSKIDLNSYLVTQQGDQELLYEWTREFQPQVKDLQLIYRATRDGFNTTSFHQHCDAKGATLTIAQVKKSGNIIGGLATQAWKSVNGCQVKGILEESFIFSLPLKKRFKCTNANFVYWHDRTYGPGFGYDILLIQGQKPTAMCSTFGKHYNAENVTREQLIGKENDYDNVELAEIEVYLLKNEQ